MKKLFMALFLMLYFSTPQICGAIDVTRHTVGGNVTGPVTGTDNAIARFDKSGKKIQNSGVTIGDTNIMTIPAGSVTAPSIVSDDADSGFYFGSKGFNWSVDGVSKFSVNSTGAIAATGITISGSGTVYTAGTVTGALFIPTANDTTLFIQSRNFTAADNMIEMAYGTTTFTGFDGEIAGVVIMPTVGALDDGDTMTVLKVAPTGTPASTLGIVRGLAFGNWGGTGTDTASMVNLNATGYDADLVRSNQAVSCAATVCTDVTGTYAIYLTTTGSDTMTLADGTFAGQEKYISHKVDGGQVTITPTNFSGGTNVVLTAAGDNVKFHWNGAKWDLQHTYRGTIN